MMKNQCFIIFVSLFIFTMMTNCNSSLQASQTKDNMQANLSEDKTRPQPNVVIILADDLGWQDVKCYDIDEPSPYETPNMDALAKEGVMFWQAYSPSPTCAPSRCAIMSGNHPARAQKTHVGGGKPPTVVKNSTTRMMEPWYSGRMPANEMTIPRALKANNYRTGHSGKWHMAMGHHSFPQPEDQGFDFARTSRGITRGMRPNRMTGFSTNAPNEKYPFGEDGFLVHQTTQDALTFMDESKSQPFFLYYAEWLVHAPIQTRNRRLLDKYAAKLGLEIPNDHIWEVEGQKNMFYCAMVEDLDYRVGQVVGYLKATDDPRWPGHKLYENTYLIVTSDNGGAERKGKEIITDNYPLDKGKKHVKEGGTRVPLIITGPGIKAGVQSDVMINGLDFYPTILALTGTKRPAGKTLDGCDISNLLLKDATDAKLVKHENGKERTSMMWHFPNNALNSTFREGDYKLVKNYDYIDNPKMEEFELYRLYNSDKGKSQRGDIEESKDIAAEMPELVNELNGKLTNMLTEMKAGYPHYNPYYKGNIPNKSTVPTVQSSKQEGNKVIFNYTENDAKVVKADLIYTLNGGDKPEEWFQAAADLTGKNTAEAMLPKGTTHYVINLIDENNFLVSYPKMKDGREMKKSKEKHSDGALKPLK